MRNPPWTIQQGRNILRRIWRENFTLSEETFLQIDHVLLSGLQIFSEK